MTRLIFLAIACSVAFLPTITVAQRSPWVDAAAIAPDGKSLAESGTTDDQPGVIKIHDLVTNKIRVECIGHKTAVNTIIYSSNGKMLASCDSAGEIRLWDAATGKTLATFTHLPRRSRSLAFSPDGKMLASSSPSRVFLWEISTGRQLTLFKTDIEEFNVSGQHVGSVAFSPDGSTIAATAGDIAANEDQTDKGVVRLWSTKTYIEQLVLRGHDGNIWGLAFSPNGKTIATCGEDKTVRLWDSTSGRQTAILKGHKARVISVVFSPDGKKVASWCAWSQDINKKQNLRLWGSELKVWELATGKERLTYEPDEPKENRPRPVFALQFSSSGKELLAVTSDHKGVNTLDIEKLKRSQK